MSRGETNSKWTAERCARAIAILRRSRTLENACASMASEFGFRVTASGLSNALWRHADTTWGANLGVDLAAEALAASMPDVDARPTVPSMPSAVAVEMPDDSGTTGGPVERPSSNDASNAYEHFERLVEYVKKNARKGGVSFEQLCDELEMSPRAARAYLDDAREVGITIDVAHEKLLFRAPEPAPSAPPIAVSPITIPGRDHKVGVYSDLHYGSLYCLREQHRDFVLRCYHDLGIRDFFCPGDLLEGYYRHAAFERSSESWEDQANEYLDSVPQLPGMRVFFIDDNHDGTWSERTGVESGRNLVRLARERGREDHFFFGSRGALVQYGDTKIELFHPKRGAAYALSYQLQNKLRDTAPARLPQILLCGHTHQYVKFRRSDCFALYAATFQHGDAPYGRSLGGDVTMGGIVLEWRIDDDGVLRHFTDTLHLARHEAKVFDVAV